MLFQKRFKIFNFLTLLRDDVRKLLTCFFVVVYNFFQLVNDIDFFADKASKLTWLVMSPCEQVIYVCLQDDLSVNKDLLFSLWSYMLFYIDTLFTLLLNYQGPIVGHQFYLLFLSCSSNLPIKSILSVISRSKYCSLSLSFLCSFWISESAWFRCASSVSFCSMNSVCWARMVSSCWILSSSWRFEAMKDSRSAKSSSRSDSSCWLHVGFDLF